MARGLYFGKNVSLRQENIYTVQGFMNKTKKNFSQTLNIIIEEWDKFSIIVQQIKDKQKQQEIEKEKENEIERVTQSIKKGKVERI